VNANEVKKGMVIEYNGDRWIVVDYQQVKPGKGPAYMQTKLKNLKSGAVLEQRLRPSEKVEQVFLEKREMEYLYEDASGYVFMEETGEQHIIDHELIKDIIGYIRPNVPVKVVFAEGKALSVDLPTAVELEVTDTDPAIRGQTATNQYKPAIVETGLKVMVPPFVNTGDVIRVDTREGKYLDRASS